MYLCSAIEAVYLWFWKH